MVQAAQGENRQTKAQADLVGMATPAQVLEALMNAKVDIEWVVKRLKAYTEKGATPVQLTCLKMIIELMANGGLISRTTLMAYQRVGGKRASKPAGAEDDSTDPADLDDDLPVMDIESVVRDSLEERRKSYDSEQGNGQAEAIEGSAAEGSDPRIPDPDASTAADPEID